MDARYAVADTSQIFTPALVVFRDIVEQNLAEMIRIAGSAARLRPHCKTHKIREVAEMNLRAGIGKHKCATIAEAEMLAQAGARDILLAYNPVGPNIGRVLKLQASYPGLQMIVTGDDAQAIAALGAAAVAAGQTVEVLVDLNTGQDRTGVAPGPAAVEIYRTIATTPGLRPGGLHLYDGQNHQADFAERQAAVLAVWNAAAKLRDDLVALGFSVPRIVAGGTGSFPIFAAIDDPALELSPGTVIFHDAGYGQRYRDMHFTPAALLLTRVVSRPGPDRITLDLGYKAVASDPPVERRLILPDLPDAKILLQNEEHLVVQTSRASEFRVGDEVWAVPTHVCPTVAMHQAAYVVWDGRVQDQWRVTGRDRMLTI